MKLDGYSIISEINSKLEGYWQDIKQRDLERNIQGGKTSQKIPLHKFRMKMAQWRAKNALTQGTRERSKAWLKGAQSEK